MNDEGAARCIEFVRRNFQIRRQGSYLVNFEGENWTVKVGGDGSMSATLQGEDKASADS